MGDKGKRDTGKREEQKTGKRALKELPHASKIYDFAQNSSLELFFNDID
jgi:hypothetical protein